MNTVVFVILDKFADWEPAFLSSALRNEVGDGFRVFFASNTREPLTSIGGMTVLPQLTLDEVPRDAEALVLIGADGSWRVPQPGAEALAREFLQRGKVVGAICDAARFLGAAGLLEGHLHTLNDISEMKDYSAYQNAAGYRQAESLRDRNLVTANGNAPLAFAADVLRALEAAPEEAIQEYVDFYSIGFHKALRKYGYVKD